MRHSTETNRNKRLGLALAALLLATAPMVQGQAPSDYRLVPQDLIIVDVVGEKDLSRECRVAATGSITFPFLKDVPVAGKTTSEVEQLLTELLNRDYLVDPQVTVQIKEYRIREVLVMGPVNKPGSILLPGEQKLTILDAIGRAGGFTPRANENKIKFTRGNQETTFSIEDLKRETNPEKIIYLQPGDVIEVRDRFL